MAWHAMAWHGINVRWITMTQDDVAARLGMSLSAYVIHEQSDTPQRLFREQIAVVLAL